jgi:hypothetical protein
MSIKTARKRVLEFLSDPHSGVLAIKGVWGAGKTFCWNDLIVKEDRENFKFESYSYISLFGVASVEQIKFNIFSSYIDKDCIG